MKAIQLGSRRYYAHVPRKLPRNPALVVALHAGAQTPEGFDRMTGWSAIATREKFVVVYPEGIGRSWNAGNGALGEAGRTGVADVSFIDSVILDATTRWGISRVLLSGHSNGSMLAHWCASADLPVRAIACVSGGLSRLPLNGVARATAVRMVHGRADTHVPFLGGEGKRALDPYDHLPIERTAEWWRGQGADVVTEWHDGGHVWPTGETERQCKWFRGLE